MRITPRFYKTKRAPEKVNFDAIVWLDNLSDDKTFISIRVSDDHDGPSTKLQIEMSKNEAKGLAVQLSGMLKFLEESIKDAATKKHNAQLTNGAISDYWYNQGKYEALVEVIKYLGLRK